MKRALLSFLSFLVLGASWARDIDPVVMTIAGKQIVRSEFEYAFNKNTEKGKEVKYTGAIKEYAGLFADYKLKVKAAEDAYLDTLGAFVKEYRMYRDTQLRPYLKDSFYIDSFSHVVYDMLKEQTGDKDMIQMLHIYLSVPQRNGEVIRERKKRLIDSIYVAMQNGADFMDMAAKYSEDEDSRKGIVSHWIAPKQMLQVFEDVAYSLNVGEYSKPFESVAGYHIVKITGHKKLEPYEEKRTELLELLKARGIDDASAEYRIEKIMKQEDKTREEVLLEIQEKAMADNPEVKYLINEYHDGLLMYEVSRMLVWDKAAEDEKGLSEHFSKHRKKFRWSEPHFKGYVVFTKYETLADKAQKLLKKCREDEGLKRMNEKFDKDSLKLVRVRYGVFAPGDDAYVDAFIFGKPLSMEDKAWPVCRLVGKLQKQPKGYKDVKTFLIPDYQDAMEKEWLDGLRKRYKVEIDWDVLKTVNNH